MAAHDVEKVARAIYETVPENHRLPWGRLTDLTRDTYRREARAAIAALGDGWPSISPELIDKLGKLATYLTEQGEYEACDLIDTVVARLGQAQGDGWRDIATLPDTPDLIMAWGPHHKIPNGAHMIWAGNLLKAHLSPDRPRPSHLQYLATHWRPLPPPPGAKP